MSHKPQATSTAAAPPASAEPAGLPPALQVLMPPVGQPHVRETRWDPAEGTAVWIDPTRLGRPLIDACLRDLFGEFGAPAVLRELEPLSRNAAFAIASNAQAQAMSWILAGQKLPAVYRLQANADAVAAAKANGAPKP